MMERRVPGEGKQWGYFNASAFVAQGKGLAAYRGQIDWQHLGQAGRRPGQLTAGEGLTGI